MGAFDDFIPNGNQSSGKFDDLISNTPIQKPENILQKAAAPLMQAMQQSFTTQSGGNPLQDAMKNANNTVFNSMGAGGAGYNLLHNVKSNIINQQMPNNPLAAGLLDFGSNPELGLGIGGGVGLAENAASDVGENISKVTRAPNVFEQRIADIGQRASRDEGALKGYQDFRTGEIQDQGNQLINASIKQAQAGKANQIGPTEDAIPQIQDQISKLSQGANVLEKQTLPNVAWESGKKAVTNIQDIISKQGNKWNQDLEGLLGGKDSDIYIDPQKITASLDSTLEKNGANLFPDENGVMQASKPLSSAEQKILNLRNSIEARGTGEQQTGYGVREMLREKRLLGQSVNYGKQWTADDYLLNQARHGIASAAEDVVPGLKEHNAAWGPFADWKEAAVKNFDVYGGKYSEAGRPFIQKEATGGLTPAQQSFAEDTKAKIGDYSGSAKQVTSGIAQKQARIDNLKATLSDLQDKVKSGSSLSPAEEQNIRQTFQKHIDDEINNVKDLTQKEIVGLQNRTGAGTQRLTDLKNAAEGKIGRLQSAGKLLVYTGGTGASLVGLWKAGGWLLHLLTGEQK